MTREYGFGFVIHDLDNENDAIFDLIQQEINK